MCGSMWKARASGSSRRARVARRWPYSGGRKVHGMPRWMHRPRSLAWHVVVVLAVAVVVFAVAVVLIWLGLGAPRPRPDAAFTTTNQLEIVKLALTVVAGV